MTDQQVRELHAREVLMRLLPDSMAFAPIGSPAGTAYAIKAMLEYARVAAPQPDQSGAA